MGIKNMQGTSAHLEYIKNDEDHRRAKKKCEYFNNKICKCYTAPTYMCKCYSPTYCRYYKEKETCNNEKLNKSRSLNGIRDLVVKKDYKKLTNNKIKLNCTVKLYDYDYKENIIITLVEPNKTELTNNKISIKSPLGSEMISKDVNEIIEVNTDKIHRYKIISWEKG